MTDIFRDSYNPIEVEKNWYEWWEKKGYFTPKNDTKASKKKFVMILPPPNITGKLHIGHALTCAIEDSIIRYHRMCGKEVLWLPGLDHAGIATQVVVEKKLIREDNMTRHDLGRDKFIQKIWEWKHQYGENILLQLKRMGSSLDWSRETFTMDQKCKTAVTEAFIRLFQRGKISRATRLVNWSCALRSAISNIEVEYIELKGRKRLEIPGYEEPVLFGEIISFAYKTGDGDEIIVSTTRIETMLGDVAVAIHPDDERYKHLHGKTLIHPFIPSRKISIIVDDKIVDRNFGTGAVKITPAHDPNDYECGKRHNLPMINILNDDGTIQNGGCFSGMQRYDARIAIIKALKKEGLYRGSKNHPMSIAICSRSKDIIEPILKPQWWLDCREMADRASKAVKNGNLKIYPKCHTEEWYRWLDKTEDWCISRQLWWGHRIPAWIAIKLNRKRDTYERAELKEIFSKIDTENTNNWIIARNKQEAFKIAETRLLVDKEYIALKQDEDVLDTWFSSGLFPFSAIGWPNCDHTDFREFFPNSLLETGWDILFFWVARMVMMSLELTDRLPFKEIFLHALIRDASGRKMSKSLGNVINPIDVIEGCTLKDLNKQIEEGTNLSDKERIHALKDQKKNFPNGIKQCGTDALRFALCTCTSNGKNINLDISRVESYRNFCNKIWNVLKFSLPLFSEDDFNPNPNLVPNSIINRWILSHLFIAVQEVNVSFKEYNFAAATSSIYDFWLNKFCDIFIESIKPIIYNRENDRKETLQTLYICIDTGLCLLHPFMPYITEELYQKLPMRGAESICISSFPQECSFFYDKKIIEEFEWIDKINIAIRASKSMYMKGNIRKQDPNVYLRVISNDSTHLIETIWKYKKYMETLVWCSNIKIIESEKWDDKECSLTIVDNNIQVYVEVSQLGLDYSVEIGRMKRKLNKIENQLKGLEKRTSRPQYKSKVPQNIQEGDIQKMYKITQEIILLKSAIQRFERLL